MVVRNDQSVFYSGIKTGHPRQLSDLLPCVITVLLTSVVTHEPSVNGS